MEASLIMYGGTYTELVQHSKHTVSAFSKYSLPWIIKLDKTVNKLHLWLLNKENIINKIRIEQKRHNAARQSGYITVLAVLAKLFVK